MSYSIKVQKSPEFSQGPNETLFFKEFSTQQEFEAVEKLCVNVERVGWLGSLIMPVRTDNLRNFCEDFFLPGFFNVALKTNDTALRVFLCLLMPIYDIITLPLRAITAIPRALYNAYHSKESHPFHQYLTRNGVAPADLEDHVHVLTNKVVTKNGTESSITQGITFNFIQLPEGISEVKTYYSAKVSRKSNNPLSAFDRNPVL